MKLKLVALATLIIMTFSQYLPSKAESSAQQAQPASGSTYKVYLPVIFNSYTPPPPDTTPPAAISDLAATRGSSTGTIDLNWTAPGNDGTTGTAASYLVRSSSSAILTETDWSNASPINTGIPSPQAAGSSEHMTVSGLTPGATYYFNVRAQDQVPHLGVLSNSPSAAAFQDFTPPAAIIDLTAFTGTSVGTVNLSWTAPGNDGSSGTASSYLIRSSSSAILTETDWSNATPLTTGIPTPQAAGSSEHMTVSGLTPGGTYYFDVRAEDAVPNLGGLSNSPSAVAYIDLPPAAITDLAATAGSSDGSVNLTWTAPGSDGSSGTVSDYLVRKSTSAILTETDWGNASPITTGIPTPQIAGSSEHMTVGGLTIGATYYFAVRAEDATPNLGGLSNSPNSLVKGPPAAITDLGAVTGVNPGDVALSWTAVGAYAGSGTASSYLVRTSTSAITDQTTWNAATPVSTGVPTPQAAGAGEQMTVTGLTQGSTYYFAVRAQNDFAEMGGLSNSPHANAQMAQDLAITKSHTGNFRQGQTGASYTITVSNAGGEPSVGQVAAMDTLPTGLSATDMSGTGWNCTLGSLSCTRSDGLPASASYPAIILTVDIANNASASLTNSATVSGGGELNTSNDSVNDATTIIQAADLTIAKTHSGNFRQGQTGASYSITVSNNGTGPSVGTMSASDTLPTGLTATDMGGTGWTCTLASLSCTRSDGLAASASYPAITLTVNVANNASPSLTNSAIVSGGGELNTSNDSVDDVTTVIQVADLTIVKTHSGNFQQGQTGASYSITVSNNGTGPSVGTVSVSDTLPTGLGATDMSGTGWNCTLASLSCTRSDGLAASASYPAITLSVNVANNASPSLTNSAIVSGGGELNSSNDSVDDVTTIIQVADLTIAKTHSGNFRQGQTGASYSITVSNNGTGPSVGTVSASDTVPSGLSATDISGTGWNCTLATLTCTRNDALAANASYPVITLTVNVANNAQASLTNTATVTGGGELNTANDTANDPTTIDQVANLTVLKSHSGNFRQGQNGATYTITVTDIGLAATSDTVSVVDSLPTSLTATGISGDGWSCSLSSLTCTRTDVLAASASYPAITLTVNVANDAPASLTNSATVSGGGELIPTDDTANNLTNIDQAADLTITKTHSGNFRQGQTGASYTVTVSNTGTGPTLGTVSAIDTLPTSLSATAMSGTGWSCTLATLSCTRSDVLSASASYPVITLTVNVANDASTSLTNTATVSGGGELNTANDTASDLTGIDQAADLTILKSHTGNFRQGQAGATYTLTVTDSGTGPTVGTVSVVDTLPTGLSATNMGGTGWNCTLASLNCTRSDVLAASASYPAITLTVNVAANAPTSLTNTASVSGGGELNTTNDASNDQTAIDQAADLTITKMHSGNFHQGQADATYSITVTNGGIGATVGTVSVSDSLPTGLTATALAGMGWNCTLATLICTRSDVLAASASYPIITLTVNVANNAPASLTNTTTVSGGGELNTANDTANDLTTITADTTPPGDIQLTATTGTTEGTVDLSWIAPADDGLNPDSGRATAYLARMRSDHAILTEADWSSATPITSGVPAPLAEGTQQSMIVRELTSGSLYYFAVRAQDEIPNISGWSGASSTAALIPNTAFPIVSVPATITANTTWTAGNVYIITGLVTVNGGVTLTLQPGVIVKFQTSSASVKGRLLINGQLQAQGLANAQIVFTSINDDLFGGDSNNNGAATWPAGGDWDRLEFGSTSTGSVLDHTLVYYAGGGGDAAVKDTGAAVNLTNSFIRYSSSYGLKWINNASGQITGNGVAYALSGGMNISGSSSPTIQGNTFSNNGSYAIYMEASSFPVFGNNAVTSNITNGIGVYGAVGTGTWYADMPYIATVNLVIGSSSTLTLQPGIVVKFLTNTNIIVQGALVAPGTSANPIVFTSLKDDTYGADTNQDGSATSPAPGDWGTLYFADTSSDATCALAHVIIRYGGASYNYGSGSATADLTLDSASPQILASRFEYGSGYGVQALNASSPNFQNNSVNANLNSGIWLSPSSSPQVLNNSFTLNGGYAAYVSGSSNVVFGGNTASGNKINGIGLSGTINSSTTLELDLPYVIDSALTLDLNTTLTIQPDVIVKLSSGASFTVNGQLMAQGSAAHRIFFSSIKDDSLGGDTNGDGGATIPGKGDWNTIQFGQTAGASSLDYVTVRYGGNTSTTGAIYLNGSAPTLGHLVVMGSQYRGLYAQNTSPYIQNAVFSQNDTGVYNGTTAYLIINNSDIYGNTSYGLNNGNTTYTLNATNNWWGNASGPTISSNPTGTGDKVSSYVSFSPWLGTAPVTQPAPLPTFPTPPTFTLVSGTISTNTTWALAQSPYIVTGDVTVNAGIQLTIQPGVIVKFQSAKNLIINGILEAEGTTGSHIIFTSYKDDSVGGDSNGDGSATYARPGDWGRIYFGDPSVDALNKLRLAEIRYAGSSGSAVYVDTSSPTVSDDIISQNAGYGLYLHNYAAPTVQRDQILNNASGGIRLELTSAGTITDNQLTGNTGYAIYLDSTCYPTLTNNTASNNQVNGVRDSGAITSSQTWNANLPYVIEGTITINSGPVVTIQPGTVVKFKDTTSVITVNGALVADASTGAPIVFTSFKDDAYGGDTNNDGASTASAPGDWQRIYFVDSSDDSRDILRNVLVRYGGASNNNSLAADSAAPRILNSTIEYSSGYGLSLTNLANPQVDSNTFLQNGLSGINITTSSAPTVSNNTFQRNKAYAVELTAESKPHFSGNSSSSNGTNGIKVAGTISGATTWDANLVYVAGAVTIPSGSSLTLSPGVIVKFMAATSWTVNGPLLANGTNTNNIIFTSLKDDSLGGDTNNDGALTAPAAGDWGSLIISSTASASQISYARVRYGGDPAIKVSVSALPLNNSILDYNTRAAWYDQSNGTISTNSFLHNVNYGLYETASGLTIQNNTFLQNKWGAYVTTATGSQAVISGNIFSNNSGYAIYFDFASYPFLGATNTFLYPGMKGNAIRVPSGTLTTNTTLIANAVYWLDSWTVGSGVTLTIPANTVIKLQSASLAVQGSLVAQGSSASPVVITSLRDDTYGGDTDNDGGTTPPAAGDWYTIIVENGSLSLDHTIVQYGGGALGGDWPWTPGGMITQNYGDRYGGGSFSAQINITNSSLRYSARPAIDTINGTSVTGNIAILNSTISNNSTRGLDISGVFPSTIDSSIFNANVGNGLQINTAQSISLTNNTFSNNQGYAATLTIAGQSVSIAGNTGAGNKYQAINYSGTYNDITLDPQGALVLQLAGTIPTGKTMTLHSGVIVKLLSASLAVQGSLVAQGSSASPVVITSLRDDTYGGDTDNDGGTTPPAAGDWYTIIVENGSLSLDHTIVQYGGGALGGDWPWTPGGMITQNYGDRYGGGSFSAQINITNSSLRYSARPAIDTINGTSVTGNIAILNSTISNNSTRGLDISGVFPSTIDSSIFNANVGNGLQINTAQSISLTNNTFSNNQGYAATLTVAGQSVSIAGNSGTGNKYQAINYSGTYNDITLDPQGALILQLAGTIPTGKTMTLHSGVIVKLLSASLAVQGSIVAQGSSASPVVITSLRDDTYGGDTDNDGGATPAAAGDWYTIIVENGSLLLDHTIIQYGGGADNSSWYWIPGGMITQNYGDRYGGGSFSAQINITNSSLRYSARPGIHLINGTGLSVGAAVHNSNITNNSSYGIYSNIVPSVVDARNNWWGDASGPSPYGIGNGINYRTYTCGTPPGPCTDYTYYVNAYPYVGSSTTTASNNIGQNIAWNAYAAEPVNTANGNYAYARTDLSIPTRSLPLAFTRSYNSFLPQNGRLGYGWTFSYNVSIAESGTDGSATITYGDGRTVTFTKSGSTYTPPAGTFSTLTKSALLFTLTEKDQTVYHFDSLNRLMNITDRNGNVTSLNYTGTQLAAVSAPDGRSLGITYDGSNRITQVNDPLGRTLNFSYDASGNLATFTDLLGKVTTYAYDASHRLTAITDANGHTFVSNTYDSAGRVSQQRDAANNLTTFAYDTTNHKTTVTDPLGHATLYEYDASMRLVKETDPLGGYMAYGYDAANNRSSVRDRNGHFTNYTYDGAGNLITTTNPLSGLTSNTYDANNNLLTSTDPLGHTITYTYDSNNNPSSMADALGGVIQYAYYTDAARKGLLNTQTDALGRVTTYDYDVYGNATTITDALGHSSTHTYDLGGRLLTATDPLGHTTTNTYDAADHILTSSDPGGGVTTNTYDNVGNLLTTADPLGHTTTNSYTVKDQLATVTDAAGFVTTYGYDTVGNRTSVKDGNNHTSTYAYDGDNRLTGTTNPLGKTTSYGYDAAGNRTSLTDANGHTTTYAFDALNRQTTVTDALGHATTTAYDAAGNVTSVTDANGHGTTYAYDALNRLTSVTDALSGVVSYTYDATGNRLTMVDANSHTTTYTYDGLNHLLSEADPLGDTWMYSYDAAGRRTSQTDANSVTTSYIYNADGRLTGSTAPSISISTTYDLAGNRTALTDGTGTTSYTYDVDNRPTSVAQPNGTITYTYDAVNKTSLTLPGSLTTTYSYDAANHLTGVSDWGSRNTSYAYDNAGRLITTTFPNGVVTTNTYDNADRLAGISTVKGATTILSIGYSLDNVGNRLTMLEPSGTTSYSYDGLNRLTAVTYPSGSPASVSYTYDAMGNRLTMLKDGVTTSFSYDAADRLTSTSGGASLAFTWDANGQMLTKGSQSFSWDTLGRMTGLTNGGTTASYSYNGDGVRIGRTVSGIATSYLQDLAAGLPQVMSETTGGNTLQYVVGSDLIAQVNGSMPSYYHADGLGSTRAMTDSTGTATATYTYDAFGTIRTQSGGTGNEFTFTGEESDNESGLLFLRSRYYDNSTGRFLQRDAVTGSVLNPQTWNMFIYVTNDPVRLVDPLGLWGISPRIGLGGTGSSIGGAELSGGVGPDLEFPSWNPLDWRIGVGVGGEGKVSAGVQAEASLFVKGSIYVWDRAQPIPGASDAPITSCGGGSGSIVAGAGFGVSGAACTGEGKTGVKIGGTLNAGAGGGVNGFVSVGAGKSWTWSLRDLWNGAVNFYNKNIVNGFVVYAEEPYYYPGDGFGGGGGVGGGGGGGGSWSYPPSQGK